MGNFHHVCDPYLLRYAQEASWREDARRVDNGAQMRRVAELALDQDRQWTSLVTTSGKLTLTDDPSVLMRHFHALTD